jgi:ABC-2 type transport system permease protein
MTAFWSITRITMRQLADRKRVLGFGLLSVVPALLLIIAAQGRTQGGVESDLAGLVVTPFFAFVIPVVTLIVAVSALGDERRDKTLSFLVLRPVGRLEIAAAKTLAASLVASGFAVLGGVALTLSYVVVGGGFAVLPAILLGAVLACFLYGALFVLLGFAAPRPTLIGLAWILLIENAFVPTVPGLSAVSPWRVGLAATLGAAPEGFPALEIVGAVGYLSPSLPASALETAAVGLLAVAACAVLLRRLDSV